MTDSLPANWSTAELGDLVTVCRPRADPSVFPDMPFVGMDNVEAHTMRLLGTVSAGTMRSNATHFYPQDVLYGRLRPYLNKVVAPRFEGLASAEFIPLTPEPGIDRDFVRYRVNAADFVSFTSDLDEGDRPRVDWNGIRQFQVSLPPSAEQGRIVEIVDSYVTRLDAAVASLEGVQIKLRAYRASVLKAAVEGRLVPTEASLARAENRAYESAEVLLARILTERRRRWEQAELAKVTAKGKPPKDDRWKKKYREPVLPDRPQQSRLPEGWTWASADQLSEVITDGEHVTPPRSESGVLLLSARNVLNGELSLQKVDHIPEDVYEGLSRRLNVGAGDVLLSCSGTVGRSCVVPQGMRFALVRSVAVLKPLFGMGPFLSCCLRSPIGQNQIHRKKTQTAQSNLFQEKIRTLAIPLPPLAEQDRITIEIDTLSSICKAAESAVQANRHRCDRLRQSTLKWAFEGKLVDQDPADEPAENLLARIRDERAAVAPARKNGGRRAKGAA